MGPQGLGTGEQRRQGLDRRDLELLRLDRHLLVRLLVDVQDLVEPELVESQLVESHLVEHVLGQPQLVEPHLERRGLVEPHLVEPVLERLLLVLRRVR